MSKECIMCGKEVGPEKVEGTSSWRYWYVYEGVYGDRLEGRFSLPGNVCLGCRLKVVRELGKGYDPGSMNVEEVFVKVNKYIFEFCGIDPLVWYCIS